MNLRPYELIPTLSADKQSLTLDQIDLLKRTICKGTTDDEFKLFLNVCQRTGLDPFARQVFAVKRWDAKEQKEVMQIQTSVDGLRLIAERSGKYAGQVGPFWCSTDGIWHDVWAHEDFPLAAKVGVLRSDFKEPLFAVARFDAYAQKTKTGDLFSIWKKMPELMIGKCAESLALRRAFPQESYGLYTQEEMGQADQPSQPQPAEEKGADQEVSFLPNTESQTTTITPLRQLAEALRTSNWKREEAASYANRAYGVTDSMALTPEQIRELITIMRFKTFAQAIEKFEKQ